MSSNNVERFQPRRISAEMLVDGKAFPFSLEEPPVSDVLDFEFAVDSITEKEWAAWKRAADELPALSADEIARRRIMAREEAKRDICVSICKFAPGAPRPTSDEWQSLSHSVKDDLINKQRDLNQASKIVGELTDLTQWVNRRVLEISSARESLDPVELQSTDPCGSTASAMS